MSFDRRWLDDKGSEDCHGRALWALGIGVGRSPDRNFQMMAGQLFPQALPVFTEFTSPRAWAFGLIGIHEYLRRLSGDSLVNQTRDMLTCRLMKLFDCHAEPDWHWFEKELSYDNAKLSHALILTGRATGQQAVLERGLHSLRWLNELQVSERGHFRPIGATGSIDAEVLAPISISNRSKPTPWFRLASKRTAPRRMHGGTSRPSEPSIGSSDGTIWDSKSIPLKAEAAATACTWIVVNGNQGAESTLAFLLSLEEMRSAQNMVTSFKEPIALGA